MHWKKEKMIDNKYMNAMIQSRIVSNDLESENEKILMQRDRSWSAFSRDVTAPAAAAATAACIALREHSSGS